MPYPFYSYAYIYVDLSGIFNFVGNMDGSNDVRNPNAVRNPKPTYASVVAADAPAGSNANHRKEMEKQDRMKKVSFLLFNPVR